MISRKRLNILFVATDKSYFVDEHTTFTRMYNVLRYFHNHKDFNVFVLQPDFDKEKEKPSLKQNIKTFYFRQIKVLWATLVPFTDFNPFYISKIFKIVRKYKIDLIHVDFPFGINYLRLITKIPVSYNSYNVEFIYANQIGKYFYKIPKILRPFFPMYIYLLEKYALKHVKNVNALTSTDKETFNSIYKIPKEKIFINTWGYNEDIFNNLIDKNKAREKLGVDKDKFIVIFHGSYFLANKQAIDIITDEIAPRIQDKDILFLIAGKLPNFKNKENLRFMGYLDDLKYFLYSSDVAITPVLTGSGIKTKSMDYLSAGIPIISTKLAANGLLLKNGIHGYIINRPIEDTIEKIIYLKNNPYLIKEFKANIKNLILKNFKWENILEQLASRYKEIIKLNKIR